MYKIGDKFEIEIDSDFVDENENKLYRIKGFNSLVFDENGLIKLKKAMSESDIIKLKNKAFLDGYTKAQREAFDRGYDEGYDEGYKDGCKSCEEKYKNNANEPIKTVKASELAVDTRVICWDEGQMQNKRHFAGFEHGSLYAFNDGDTWWNDNPKRMTHWQHMTLEDGTVVLPK